MLRFSFMDETAGSADAVQFLSALARELAAYVPRLRVFLRAQAPRMPLSGKLALEHGIRAYETLLAWARSALGIYMRRKKKGARR